MENILFAWIGKTDLDAAQGTLKEDNVGPIAQALSVRKTDKIVLLSNYSDEINLHYKEWLKGKIQQKTDDGITVVKVSLPDPRDHGLIYEHCVKAVQDFIKKNDKARLIFHISPGTPSMHAVWILLAKTRFQGAELIQSSLEKGVQTVKFPFDISADYLPDFFKKSDEQLIRLTQGLPPEAPEFKDIIHRSVKMKEVVALARRLALTKLPVLIEGETGTGKELFAKAIHNASPRRDKKFVPINCGALPITLAESEFFGYKKGAFTGADKDCDGAVATSSGGTLFLDEIGELSPEIQVKLLRVLQEGKVRRLGDNKETEVDLRIIAATNRNLQTEVAQGRFREDLFYRIAAGYLHLPALHEREGDLSLLMDHILEKINADEEKTQKDFQHKKISASAKNFMLSLPWRGNFRELEFTIRRAALLWSSGSAIDQEDIEKSLLTLPQKEETDILNRPLGNGLNIEKVMGEVARHYLERAFREAGGNKTKAANLVGLSNYQTFTNWSQRYDIEDVLA